MCAILEGWQIATENGDHMFTSDERMNDSGQKWVKGFEPATIKGASKTAFDAEVEYLGLNPASDLRGSKELKAWATSLSNSNPEQPNYNVVFIPESLLKAWRLKTMWDGDEAVDTDDVPVVPFSDMFGTDYELNARKDGTPIK